MLLWDLVRYDWLVSIIDACADMSFPVRWMPPESLGKLQYSEKSDVWAFASTLFELFSGREPFQGEDLISVAVAVRDTGSTY